MLDDAVLTDLERFPESVPSHQLIDVRKLLCVSIGKLHAFLQDAFGEVMANDPRSSHDADYFLSKRFPQDLEEAEWLHSTVSRLQVYLDKLEEGRSRQLAGLIEEIRREQMIPIGRRWEETRTFFEMLTEGLTPKLKEVLALRGIRFYEVEILDRYAVEIPNQCRTLHELHLAGREAADSIKSSAAEDRPSREQSVWDLMQCHSVFGRRMAHLMSEYRQGAPRSHGVRPHLARFDLDAPSPGAQTELGQHRPRQRLEDELMTAAAKRWLRRARSAGPGTTMPLDSVDVGLILASSRASAEYRDFFRSRSERNRGLVHLML